MLFKYISISDNLLEDVIALGRKNSKTLGMFPEGAFKEHARKKLILVAINGEELLGYVLFRITQSKQILSITHLCINSNYYNQGIACNLLNQIHQKYSHNVNGINLNCREDFIAPSQFWKKYGFKPVGRNRSRSKEEKYLIRWWYDFGNQNLFSRELFETTKINVLLDSNIIIKLRDDQCFENAEALALEADWLLDEAEYFYAPEIFNEIIRDSNKERAEETRKYLQNFKEARFNPVSSVNIFNELASILQGTSENDTSDRKQVAECIAGRLEYFITMDKGILDCNEVIFEKYNLKILSPLDFILHIDQLRNAMDYAAYRVAGAYYDYKKISVNEINQLVDTFEKDKKRNEKLAFRRILTEILGDLKTNTLKLVKDPQGKLIGFIAVKLEADRLVIAKVKTIEEKIGDILFQQLIYDICILSIQEKKPLIVINEPDISSEKAVILQSFGFEKKLDGWHKIILTGLHTALEVLERFPIVTNNWSVSLLKENLGSLHGIPLLDFKLQLEKRLWPLKISDIDIPTYIVPIRSHWAAQLFDHTASSQSLFGSKAELAWSKENIYYRSVKPVSEKAPARILWYVSEDSKSPINRHKGIVACSYLNEVHVGGAKSLFQRFKNYGIYEWSDIYKLAGEDIFREIKALKFSDTEIFKKVISYEKICTVFNQCGRPSNSFASPVEVSMIVFERIYKLSQ